MSDKMFDKTPINNVPYKYGDWRKYAIHDDKQIKGFFGPYRFLSNFWESDVYYEGDLYHSSEAAYQASKLKPEERRPYIMATGKEAKEMSIGHRKIPEMMRYTAKAFDSIKYDIMAEIVFSKFSINRDMKLSLLATGDKYLEELNHWSDSWWGVDIRKGGQNNMGKILMKVRSFWK